MGSMGSYVSTNLSTIKDSDCSQSPVHGKGSYHTIRLTKCRVKIAHVSGEIVKLVANSML